MLAWHAYGMLLGVMFYLPVYSYTFVHKQYNGLCQECDCLLTFSVICVFTMHITVYIVLHNIMNLKKQI